MFSLPESIATVSSCIEFCTVHIALCVLALVNKYVIGTYSLTNVSIVKCLTFFFGSTDFLKGKKGWIFLTAVKILRLYLISLLFDLFS